MKLTSLLLFASFFAKTASAQGSDKSVVTESYETVKIASGVYAFISPDAFGGVVGGNSVVVVGDSSVLVLDPGHFPPLTKRMIGEIRKLTDRPVRYVVNSHWHPDHWMGNTEYAAAFPGVEIISTVSTRDEIIRQGPGFLAQYHDSAGFAKAYQSILAKGKSPWRPGAALDDGEKAVLNATIVDGYAGLAAWRSARLTAPTMTFDRSLNLHLGNRDVQVLFLGRGNTAGDAVVYVPDAKVVATGDLVVAPEPYAYGSYIGEWIETLGKLKQLGATTIIPGHGQVQKDYTYVDLLTELLTSLHSQVADAVHRGSDLEQTRKSVHLDEYLHRLVLLHPSNESALRTDFYISLFQPGTERAFQEIRYNSQ